MGNLGITKTLLILLLALRHLKTLLSNNELEALKNEGLALETSPEYWEEDIEPALMAIVAGNEELNQKFQYFQEELESVKEIPFEILPTWEELEKELAYGDSKPVTFGVNTDDNPDITPTTVAASEILKFVNPSQLAQKLSSLKRLENYQLQQTNITEFSAAKSRYINTGFYTLDTKEFIATDQPLALNILWLNSLRHFSQETRNREQQNQADPSFNKPELPLPPKQNLDLTNQSKKHDKWVNSSYILKVNVGKFWGIGSPQQEITEPLLKPFFEKEETLKMDVVVHSFDVKISSPQQKLQLPKTGDSSFVDFPVTFTRTGRHSIDIDLMFHGHLLQSKRVEVYVVKKSGDIAPESAFPVQDAYIIWTRSAALNPEELTFLKENPRRLTIVTQPDIDINYNRIGLRFYDTTGKDLGFQISELTQQNLTNMLTAIRKQLLQTMNAYTKHIGSTESVLTKHLGLLADIGHTFYTELLPELSQQEYSVSKEKKLNVKLQPKTIIQVAPLSSQLGVPWELLYERKIESYREGKIKLCPTWKEHGKHPEDCPSYGTKEEGKIVCPNSFWGYLYIIEQLPCKVLPHTSAPESSLPLFIRNQSPLQFHATVSTKLNELNKHWQNLRNLAFEDLLELSKIDTRDKFESALSNSKKSADILYFYTHGGNDSFRRPYLEVGDGEKIKKNDLEAWNINLKEHQPLVIVNACNSADYSPESFENLLDFFCKKGAAGVIGTQCEVKEMLANELIINFFEAFFKQTCAGEALFNSRQNLLRNNLDPRGLAYSLFASADVKLAQKVVK